jgi:hypothetical protein
VNGEDPKVEDRTKLGEELLGERTARHEEMCSSRAIASKGENPYGIPGMMLRLEARGLCDLVSSMSQDDDQRLTLQILQ